METDTSQIEINNSSITEDFTQSPKNSTLPDLYPGTLSDVASGFFILFTFSGVAGNTISILALARSPRLRNATTAFIINLCVADLIFCSYSTPLQAVKYLSRGWHYGENFVCKIFSFITYSNGIVSLFTLVAIAINRYVCVVHSRKYAAIYKPVNVAAMIFALWGGIILVLSLPTSGVWGRFGITREGRLCDLVVVNGKSPTQFIFTVCILLPSLVFIICYFRIFWVVRKASKKMQSADVSTVSQEVQEGNTKRRSLFFFTDKLQLKRARKVRKDRKDLKVLKMSLVIFVAYMICYFPMFFIKLLKKADQYPSMMILSHVTLYLSNCINPVIYLVMSNDYRKAYLELFTCRIGDLTSSVSSQQTTTTQ